ncbi:hypothetical protein [Jidongwangia harbinensis]|uniref:hypothetical protein n=1 Tax=Jidongwangia harbinensis TaxID=2878561 RepID=UPI001CD938BB|nr:hypothetical protein [Jidongwangia harbinensis]MCA2211476.1 hypothetical protein [Jidongwangia harbinensis]
MRDNRKIAQQRLVTALDVLRGRRPKFDYGLLLVMPFLAAAGGVLISLAIDNAVERRRANGAAVPDSSGTDGASAKVRAEA